MGKLNRRLLMFGAVVAVVVASPLAGAAITIDGFVLPAGEWDGLLLGVDPNEALIPDDWDISNVFAHSDDTNANFRTDVWGTPTLDAYGGFGTAYYQVHMDLDKDAGTGRFFDGLGAEYVLDYRKIGGVPTCTLVYTADGTWTPVNTQTGALVNITEMQVLLSDMGVGPGHEMNVVFAINNGGTPPDDFTDVFHYIIPEPSCLLLVAGGLTLLGLRRFRAKK